MLVRVDFADGASVRLNPDLIAAVYAAGDYLCRDGPLTQVDMAGGNSWLVPGAVDEALRKLGFGG